MNLVESLPGTMVPIGNSGWFDLKHLDPTRIGFCLIMVALLSICRRRSWMHVYPIIYYNEQIEGYSYNILPMHVLQRLFS